MPTHRFPKLSESEMRQRLQPPQGPVRVVIDTDTANEIDDQYALAWALLSQDQLKIEGMYAEPYSFQMFSEGLLRAYAADGKPSDGCDGRGRQTRASLAGTLWQLGAPSKSDRCSPARSQLCWARSGHGGELSGDSARL